MSISLKKTLSSLLPALGLLLFSSCVTAQDKAASFADSPEEVMYNAITLIGDGRIGYAATLYMPDDGLWNNCGRNALIATENVLFAIRNGDLKTVFEQAPYLPSSSVTADEVAALTDRLPDLTPEQKTEILRKCREKCAEAERAFRIAGSMQITKRIDLTDNTVAFLLKENSADKETEYSFIALLSIRTGKWMIHYIMVDNAAAE